VASIRKAGGRASAEHIDVTVEPETISLAGRVARRLKRIDVLFNNAGISGVGDILETDPGLFDRVMNVNVRGVYLMSRAVAPHMIKSGWGRIVNIASTQAIATEATVGAYAASKGAIISFTKSLAVELAPFGINANAIAPGCIHTPMSIVNGVDETTTEYFQTWYVGKRKIPLARPGRPEEIARVAVFLASDDASYVTGHTLVADGGLTITF